jgi:hypothetical protein
VVVLAILVVMLVGSIGAVFVVPPFLDKIEPSGRVNFFGIPFLGGTPQPPASRGRSSWYSSEVRTGEVAVRKDPPARKGRA